MTLPLSGVALYQSLTLPQIHPVTPPSPAQAFKLPVYITKHETISLSQPTPLIPSPSHSSPRSSTGSAAICVIPMIPTCQSPTSWAPCARAWSANSPVSGTPCSTPRSAESSSGCTGASTLSPQRTCLPQ